MPGKEIAREVDGWSLRDVGRYEVLWRVSQVRKSAVKGLLGTYIPSGLGPVGERGWCLGWLGLEAVAGSCVCFPVLLGQCAPAIQPAVSMVL